MRLKYWGILLGIIGVLALLPWAKKQLKIDTCLDQGGRWNYQLEQCEK